MRVEYAVVFDTSRKKSPFGVVVHAVGRRPLWVAANKQGETVLRVLFSRERVFGNMPIPGGCQRVTKTWADSDYLDYAVVKVNLPLYIGLRGHWDSDKTSDTEILNYLSSRFLEKDL